MLISIVHAFDHLFAQLIKKNSPSFFTDADLLKSPVIITQPDMEYLFKEVRDLVDARLSVIKYPATVKSLHQLDQSGLRGCPVDWYTFIAGYVLAALWRGFQLAVQEISKHLMRIKPRQLAAVAGGKLVVCIQ